MNVPVILRPDAEADINRAVAHFNSIRPGLGAKFKSRVRELLERIEAFPEMYGVIWKDIRAARLRRFRHVLYYVAFADRVEVLAVLHGAQNPATWHKRH